MHSVRHTRLTFGLLQLLVAAVCAFSSLGWGACTKWTTSGTSMTDYRTGYCRGSDLVVPISVNCSGNNSCGAACPNKFTLIPGGGSNRGICSGLSVSITQYGGCYYSLPYFLTNVEYYECDSQAEADSLACLNAGNLWIDGACRNEQWVCENDGGQWVDGECRPACNDHVTLPDKCEEIWKSGYNVDGDGNPGGGGYWAITTYECFYDSCQMSLNCTEKSSFPAGNLSCNDFQDTSGTPGRCVGTMGYNCIIQCGNGATINCDCDGSCQKAINNPACSCPSSSSVGSSSSAGSSSSGESSSSSSAESSPSSSAESSPSSSGETSSGSAGGDWEYNYNPQLDKIVRNTESTVGYLSDIDRQIAALNFQQQNSDNSKAIAASVAEGTDAQNATKDTLHSVHGTLDHIDSALNQEVETEDFSAWISSASEWANNLYSQAADTSHTLVSVDSMKADTSNFKSKYSGLFISNVYTREGCYTFTIKDSGFMGMIGKTFKLGASLDFGNIGGFDLCSILRGFVRACGAILCLLITIKAYRAAFSSSDG